MSEVMPHSHPDGAAENVAQPTQEGTLAIDVVKIIQLIVDVAAGAKTQEAASKELARPVQTFAEVFVKDKAKELIAAGMGAAGIESLSNSAFSEKLIQMSEKIASVVKTYMNGEMTEEQFISSIGGSGMKEMGMQALAALGIPEKLGVDSIEGIMKLSPSMVAFAASMAAYKELRKALDDLAVARERRMQIEAACNESIILIRRYRTEMEKIVSDYLTVHIETFESGFEAMDRAMLEGDIDGYIKGNTEIQSILGYDVQFHNQDGFDALMDSDDAFKL